MGEIECPDPYTMRALDLPCKLDLVRRRLLVLRMPDGCLHYFCSNIRVVIDQQIRLEKNLANGLSMKTIMEAQNTVSLP